LCSLYSSLFIPPKCSFGDFAFFGRYSDVTVLWTTPRKLSLGDFNVPDFCEKVRNSYIRARLLKNLSDFFDLKQYNLVKNKGARMLDLVFGNLKIEVSPCADG
jgi:hypothetical protein